VTVIDIVQGIHCIAVHSKTSESRTYDKAGKYIPIAELLKFELPGYFGRQLLRFLNAFQLSIEMSLYKFTQPNCIIFHYICTFLW